jgi:PAS domain-containing protein
VTDFVGREREIAEIASALKAGTNVVLSGKFGMGRTSLLQQVASSAHGRLQIVFADFSRPPASVCRQLASQLSRPRRLWQRIEEPSYREDRRRLLDAAREVSPQAVFVLDNVARMTPAKREFLRFLSEEPSLRFVAVVESFLPEADVTRLRACLYPSIRLRLGRLSAPRSHEFFERVSRRNGLRWNPDLIRGLAIRGGGYPLAMVEAATEAATRGRGR